MRSNPTDSKSFLTWILEPTLAANLAFACVGAFLGHVANSEALDDRLDDSTYIFLRATFRIGDLLHIPSSNPVTTAAVARNFDYSGKMLFAAEACIVILTLTIALLIFLLQRRLFGIFHSAGFSTWYAGATALFAIPTLSLAVMIHNKGWFNPHGLPIGQPGRNHLFISVFLGELIGLAILIAVSRWRSLSLSVLSLLSIFHCAFWMWAFWPRFAIYAGTLKSPPVLFFCFPTATIIWLSFIARSRRRSAVGESLQFRRSSASGWLTAAVASCVLALLLLPNVFASLPTSQASETQVVEISRGPCFGPCPVYTMRIHGSGLVEYSGWWRRGGRDHGPRRYTQTEFITQAKFQFIMDMIRSTKLQTLDQRAFNGCFDTPSFSLAVTGDHTTKRITGDASCVGSKSGVQAGVVNAIAAIEKLTDTQNWICPGGLCD